MSSATQPGANAPHLSREQLVHRIQEVNPTATIARLAPFDVAALALYLEHLTIATGPQRRAMGWLRPGDTPCIVAGERRD